LVEEFEEEYGKDNREVRRQEKVESNHDYWRGGFPGRYTARKLLGWSDKQYDREYWEKLEKSRENLENAGDLLKKFEKEYSRDNREVR